MPAERLPQPGFRLIGMQNLMAQYSESVERRASDRAREVAGPNVEAKRFYEYLRL